MECAKTFAVATMTWARNDNEAALIVRCLETLSAMDLPVFVTDRGSGAGFVRRIERIAGVNVASHDAGLLPRVKASMTRAVASGATTIVYTESDKLLFIETGLEGMLRHASDQPPGAIVYAARNEESLRTYPGSRPYLEARFNEIAGRFLRQDADLVYGPMTMDAAWLRRYLEALPDDLGWGFRTYLMARGYKDGLRFVPYSGFFPCPEDQRSETDEKSDLYRLEQIIDSAQGLHRGLTVGS